MEKVYPLIIKMNSKDVQVGSVKIKFANKKIIGRCKAEWDAELGDIKIQYEEGDFITKIKGNWDND